MLVPQPVPVDPEIAGLILTSHLDALWATGRPARLGWDRLQLDDLRHVIAMPARTSAGPAETYHIRLGGAYYDVWPPDVFFVDPATWEPATGGRWFPAVLPHPTNRFGLHATYGFPDGSSRPLVCHSATLGYYQSNHRPGPGEQWQQGTHTVSATLTRVAEMLSPDFYRGPSA